MRSAPVAAAPVSPHNAFELFGLKRRFGVDRTQLERKFYELSRASHPDRFAAAGPLAQAQAVESMSRLNEAYSILKDAERLRQYLLELEGVELPGQGTAQAGRPANGPGAAPPLELAEGWFELQDAVMDDPASAPDRIAAFEEELKRLRGEGGEKLARIEREIDASAEANDHPPRELLEKLAREVRAQSYLKSMERDVDRIRKRFSAQEI
jgi:DnaJ-domain-containing protein 1